MLTFLRSVRIVASWLEVAIGNQAANQRSASAPETTRVQRPTVALYPRHKRGSGVWWHIAGD